MRCTAHTLVMQSYSAWCVCVCVCVCVRVRVRVRVCVCVQLLCMQVQSAAAAKECQKKWLRWIASCHDSHKSQHQLSLNRISAARKHLLGSVAVSQAYINSELADNPLLYPIAT